MQTKKYKRKIISPSRRVTTTLLGSTESKTGLRYIRIEWMTLLSFQCHRSIYICCVFDIFAPLLPKGLLCSWLCSSYTHTLYIKSCAGGTYRKSDLWPLSTHNDDKNTLTPATSISVLWLWLIMMCNAERHQVCLLRHRKMCPPLVSDMS